MQRVGGAGMMYSVFSGVLASPGVMVNPGVMVKPPADQAMEAVLVTGVGELHFVGRILLLELPVIRVRLSLLLGRRLQFYYDFFPSKQLSLPVA